MDRAATRRSNSLPPPRCDFYISLANYTQSRWPWLNYHRTFGASDGLDLKRDIDRSRGVGKTPDGDKIDPRLGECTHTIEIHPA